MRANEQTDEEVAQYLHLGFGGSGPQCNGDKTEGNRDNEGYEDDDSKQTKTTTDGRLTTNAQAI